VARKQSFLGADFSEQFKEAYAGLRSAQQQGTDTVVMALLKQRPTPGMRVKPVEPEKHYYDARINDGDRLIHRIEAGTLYLLDVVKHDDIDRYANTPKRR